MKRHYLFLQQDLFLPDAGLQIPAKKPEHPRLRLPLRQRIQQQLRKQQKQRRRQQQRKRSPRRPRQKPLRIQRQRKQRQLPIPVSQLRPLILKRIYLRRRRRHSISSKPSMAESSHRQTGMLTGSTGTNLSRIYSGCSARSRMKRADSFTQGCWKIRT